MPPTHCFKCKNKHNYKMIYGLHEACFLKWFDLAHCLEFRDIDPKTSSFKPSDSKGQFVIESKIEKKKDTFFQGRYLKYSAHLNAVSYILKVQEADYPELPAVEYLCNEIAVLLNLQVPPFYLIHFNERITFVTRNFMQDCTGTLHHLYKFLPAGQENHNCEGIIRIILKETGKISEVARFIEICLFDALVGNNDRHGRNLGIIEKSNIKQLAPMYDNPSFLGIETTSFLNSHFNPSGSIWTQGSREPKPQDYINEFSRLDYEMTTKHFCQKVIAKANEILLSIEKSFLGHQRKKAFRQLIESRIGDFSRAQ